MAIEPETPTSQSDEPERPLSEQIAWGSKLLHLCFVIFCFEIGLFLLVFPWLNQWWISNSALRFLPWLTRVWNNPYFRGALSGLGLVNIYISFLEVVRLLHVTPSSQNR